MDQIRLTLSGMMPESFELTLGANPHLKVTRLYQERVLDPDPAAVARLVRSVRTLRLPARPKDAMSGLDGVTYNIRFSKEMTAVEYSWWCDPPTGWEPLARIARQLMALGGRRGRTSGYFFRDPDSVCEISSL